MEGDEHLDHQLVPGRRRHVRRRAQPVVELLAPGVGDVEAFCGPGGVVGLDQPVTLEPLQGRVHLPDVQRPHLAGAGLELLASWKPYFGTSREQGQQRMADHHAEYTTQ